MRSTRVVGSRRTQARPRPSVARWRRTSATLAPGCDGQARATAIAAGREARRAGVSLRIVVVDGADRPGQHARAILGKRDSEVGGQVRHGAGCYHVF